jgi:hypothetical protein
MCLTDFSAQLGQNDCTWAVFGSIARSSGAGDLVRGMSSMAVSWLELRKLLRIVLSVLASLVVIAALQQSPRADETHLIVIPADDGYGIQDCLIQSKGCGEMVAAAWCETKGYSSPLAFGRAEDVTGAIAGIKETKLDPNSYIIECAN